MYTTITVGDNEYRIHDADQYGGHLTELIFSNPYGETLYIGKFANIPVAKDYIDRHSDHIEAIKKVWA